MADIPLLPQLPPLPPLPDSQPLASAATAQPPTADTTTPKGSRHTATLPSSTPAPSTPAATNGADTAASPASSASASPTSSTVDAAAATSASGGGAGDREYYDAPGSTVRGSSVWQSIRLIRGDDDHVHCMRCGKDLKHNRTQARLTGTSNLSRHLRKCKGPPLPSTGTEAGDEHKENGGGGGGGGSERKRKREASNEETKEGTEEKSEKKEAAATATPAPSRRSARGAAHLENGDRAGHHASLLQLQSLHDAALTRFEQSKQQPPVKAEGQVEQLSAAELRRMMQWHSTAIQRLQCLVARQVDEEWKEKAGKNVCRCCLDVESEVQLEPCKHVVWCRGCSTDKCAVCGIAVLAKAQVSSEPRGDG